MTMPVYGLFVFGAAVLFFLCMALYANKTRPGLAQVYCVIALPVSLLLSRLVFCLVSAGYFFSRIAQPVKMLYLFDGGYSMTGLILGLIASAAITARIMKTPFGKIMDWAALAFSLPLLLLRLGEGNTKLGIGREIVTEALRNNAFFARMDETGVLRHAVFQYEAAYALLLFIAALLIAKKPWRQGDKALLLGALYGAGQIIFESMRDDFHMVWGFVRAQQIFAIFLPVAAIVVFSIRLAKDKNSIKKLIPYWAAAGLGIALGIIKEFDVDTSQNLFLDYGMMAFAVFLLVAAAYALMKKCNRAKA